MVNTIDSNRQLEGSLHYDPDAYWCPHCWKFTKDCQHLVPPLTTRLVHVEDWLIRALRYDRNRQILGGRSADLRALGKLSIIAGDFPAYESLADPLEVG